MEEVDGIILVSLRQLEVPVGEITSLQQINTDLLYAAVVAYLKVINPEKNLPAKLPKETARGYRVGEELATTIKGLGYPNELGFDQFLYPNVVDVRKLLSFLMEQMPHKEEAEVEVLDTRGLQRRTMQDSLRAWKAAKYLPPFLSAVSQPAPLRTNRVTFPSLAPNNKAIAAYDREHLPLATSQVISSDNIAHSLVHNSALAQIAHDKHSDAQFESEEAVALRQQRRQRVAKLVSRALQSALGPNAQSVTQSNTAPTLQEIVGESGGAGRSKGRKTAFDNAADFNKSSETTPVPTDTQSTSEISDKEKREQERREKKERLENEARRQQEELQLTIESLVQRCDALAAEMAILRQTKTQIQSNLDQEGNQTSVLEDEYTSHKTSLEMLDNFDANYAQLQQITAASGARLVELATEWEKHRAPMLKIYREHKTALTQRRNECKQKLEKIKVMRLDMKQMIQSLQDKDQIATQMRADYEKMPKSVTRNAYTARILEIVKNVKKQSVDIKNILTDIRDVQKEISVWEDTLKRSYVAADEAVFSSAKKDKDLKSAYKLFVDLHGDFTALVECIEQQGKARSEARQLESKCDAIEAQNHSLNFDKIAKDLAQVKAENAELAQKLGR